MNTPAIPLVFTPSTASCLQLQRGPPTATAHCLRSPCHGVVELDDLDIVGVLLEQGGDGQAIPLIVADAPVHGVDVPGCLVHVDL